MIPLIGGRGYIIPQLAVYRLIYCQLGDYMLPTTLLGEPETTIDPVPRKIKQHATDISDSAPSRLAVLDS